MHAATLADIGISALFTVTFHCNITLSRCTNETITRNIAVTAVDVFIIILLYNNTLFYQTFFELQ